MLARCTNQFRRRNRPDTRLCRKKYCDTCISKFYDEKIAEVRENATWSCPACRGTCTCAACTRARELARLHPPHPHAEHVVPVAQQHGASAPALAPGPPPPAKGDPGAGSVRAIAHPAPPGALPGCESASSVSSGGAGVGAGEVPHAAKTRDYGATVAAAAAAAAASAAAAPAAGTSATAAVAVDRKAGLGERAAAVAHPSAGKSMAGRALSRLGAPPKGASRPNPVTTLPSSSDPAARRRENAPLPPATATGE